jgi:predicted RNA-binding Zn-ribbon protein involved in translation (DUF1610 family)
MQTGEAPLPTTTVACSQCGGELHPDEGQIFLTCPYCSATVYLDKSRVVFHWYLAPTLNDQQALGSLNRWMAGNQTVKDLDRKSRVISQSFQYFPLWYFKYRGVGGKEEVRLEPAAATSVTEMLHLRLPAGDLRKVDASIEPQAQMPTVPLDLAMGWADKLAPQGVPNGRNNPQGQPAPLETSLVHIPVYTFKYTYQNKTYTALVEGATGAVLANIFPAKSEAPYLLAGGLAGGVFLCLATFPVIGALFSGEEGLAVGAALCLGLGVIAAPLLFALAAWVAAKV